MDTKPQPPIASAPINPPPAAGYQPPQPSPRSPLPIVLVTLLVTLSLGAAAFFGYQYYTLKNQTPPPVVQTVPAAVTLALPSPTVPPADQPDTTPAAAKAGLTGLDAVWNLYTNPTLGFSIKVPKTATEHWGTCTQTTTNNQKTYSPQPADVPVVVQESGSSVFITSSYFYDPTIVKQADGSTVYTQCTKTTTTAKLITEREQLRQTNPTAPSITPRYWQIKVATVNSDAEFAKFIKTNYGSGCSVGDTSENPNGYLDVKIKGDGKDMEDTACPLNFVYALKYSPTLHQAATWGVGQEITFSADDYKTSYDADIINSFKFLP